MARGFTDKAAHGQVKLIRRSASGEQETVLLDLSGSDPQARDLPLRDGDTLLVPTGNAYYVLGEVRHPGAYQVGGGTTAVGAVTLAGGFTEKAGQTQINQTQIIAWLTAGIPSYRVAQLVQQHGLASVPTQEQLHQLESAGATANLIQTLSAMKAPASPATQIPPALLKAADENRRQHYHEAELHLREALRGDPQNAALHFALAAMLRQQSQWDDAFDEITQSARLMPDLPENHSAFAYIFYRLDDGPNAIAEFP